MLGYLSCKSYAVYSSGCWVISFLIRRVFAAQALPNSRDFEKKTRIRVTTEPYQFQVFTQTKVIQL